MAFVNPSGDFRVPACAENWRGASVGVDAGEIVGSQRETAVRVVDRFGTMQEEGALGIIETALIAAENESAELESGVDIGEERRQIRSQAAVLKVKEAANAPAGGYGFEEASGGLIGVDARGCKEADNAVRLNQIHGALDEERVEVDSASA